MMRHKDAGFTLLELLASMAVATLLLIGLNSLISNALDDSQADQAGLYQAQITNAATQYILTNYATLVSAPQNPSVLALTDLTGASPPFLPSSTATSNSFGQTPCIIVYKMPLQPGQPVGSNQLQALAITYARPNSNAKPIKLVDLAYAASNAGVGGGYFTTANGQTIAQGSSWQLPATAAAQQPSLQNFTNASCALTPGYMASAIFFNGPGQLSSDYLYRNAVGGHPELNTMNTPLYLNKQAQESENASCAAYANSLSGIAIAIDKTTNSLLACDSNTQLWTSASSWKAPIKGTYYDLPTTGNNAGDVRMVMDQTVAPATYRAYTYDGNAWVALAVDQNGNFTVPSQIEVQNGQVLVDRGNIVATDGSITAGSNMTAGNNIAVGNDLIVTNASWLQGRVYTGYDYYNNGNPIAGGSIAVNGYFTTSGPVTYVDTPQDNAYGYAPGNVCNSSGYYNNVTRGQTVSDYNGALMYCKIPADVPNYEGQGILVYQNGQTSQ